MITAVKFCTTGLHRCKQLMNITNNQYINQHDQTYRIIVQNSFIAGFSTSSCAPVDGVTHLKIIETVQWGQDNSYGSIISLGRGKWSKCGLFFALLIRSIFLNCSEEILPFGFQTCFRFVPSSSRTQARAVRSWWHWRWFVAPLSPKLQTAQTAQARVLDELGTKQKHF